MNMYHSDVDHLSGSNKSQVIYMDATTLTCPLPVLKAKEIVKKELKQGDRLVVRASDRSFKIDFIVMCDAENCVLENTEVIESEGVVVYTIYRPSNKPEHNSNDPSHGYKTRAADFNNPPIVPYTEESV
jgi:TusA-related sulfurtransferase